MTPNGQHNGMAQIHGDGGMADAGGTKDVQDMRLEWLCLQRELRQSVDAQLRRQDSFFAALVERMTLPLGGVRLEDGGSDGERRVEASETSAYCFGELDSPSKQHRISSYSLHSGTSSRSGNSSGSAVCSSPSGKLRRQRRLRQSAALGKLQDALRKTRGGGGFAENFANRLIAALAWWSSLEEPPRRGLLARVVKGQAFDMLCATVVLFNSAFTVYSENVHSQDITAEPTRLMRNIELGCLCFYIVEIFLKLIVHRIYFFCNSDMGWNIFDFLLVALALYEYILVVLSRGEHSATSMTFMRSFRLLRITRVVRMLRVIRLFRELQTMLQTLMNSLVSLFWCLVMLAFILVMFSLIFVQAVAGYRYVAAMGTNGLDPAIESDLLKAFGSVEHTMTTLYMASTGGEDWHRFYELVSLTGSFYGAMFLFYIAFFHFAVINVLTGIFVDHVQKVAQKDSDILILEQRRKEDSDAKQLRRLCRDMDVDRSGTITTDEFMRFSDDDNARALLASIGLDIQDAEVFFNILCNINGGCEVEIGAFVDGCLRLKGSATSIDMQTLMFKLTLMQRAHESFGRRTVEHLELLAARLSGTSPVESACCLACTDDQAACDQHRIRTL